MAYIQQYLSDNIDEPTNLVLLARQIAQLGFDRVKEVPVTFSHYQITEGFDIYDEVRQSLRMESVVNNKPATVSFVFRAIRDEQDADFRLIDIEAKVYVMEGNNMQKVTDKYFGRKSDFPTKDQMVKEIVDTAINLDRANEIKQKFNRVGSALIDKSIRKGRTFKP